MIAGERSRVDFFCVDDDGFDHWIEVKNCHSTYPDEELLGLRLLSRLRVGARRCTAANSPSSRRSARCTVLTSRPAPTSRAASAPPTTTTPACRCREAARARASSAARATSAAVGTTVDNEIPVDLDPPSDSALRALHRSWARAASITGWDRTFGADAPKRVANGPFKHNRGRHWCCDAAAEEVPPTATSAHFKAPTTFSPHFEIETPTPKKRKRKPAAATPAP